MGVENIVVGFKYPDTFNLNMLIRSTIIVYVSRFIQI